jgi:hypothetical protein
MCFGDGLELVMDSKMLSKTSAHGNHKMTVMVNDNCHIGM